MPKKPDETRTANQMVGLQLRFKETTRAKLEAAAKANGTSLNSEVVARLERSLADDEQAGGLRNQRLFNALGGTIAEIEARTGAHWNEDVATFAAVRRALLATLADLAPAYVNQTEVLRSTEELLGAIKALQAFQRMEPSEKMSAEEIATWVNGAQDMVAQAQAEDDRAMAPHREEERKGRAIYRQWKEAKRLKSDRSTVRASHGA